MGQKAYLKKTLVAAGGILAWGGTVYGLCKVLFRLVEHAKKREQRFRFYYLLENQWLRLHHEGYTLEDYFIKHQIQTIAVYGMDDMGNRVQEELSGSKQVKIAYLIDEDAYRRYGTGTIVDFEDDWEDVDLILVTDGFYYPEIKEKIQKKGNWPTLSLKDIILELQEEQKKRK